MLAYGCSNKSGKTSAILKIHFSVHVLIPGCKNEIQFIFILFLLYLYANPGIKIDRCEFAFSGT